MLLEGIGGTLYMTLLSTLFAYLIGLPLGILTVITGRNGIKPCRKLNMVLGWIVNIGRSIPFIILIVALIPFTKFVIGRTIGPTAAIVPLVIAAAPFIARLVEQSLEELDSGIVEAAKTMGASNWQIIYKVLLPEAIPSLIRGGSITTITLIGYSAMAGCVGAGGLGDIAIRYGYHRYQSDIMIITIILLVIIVQVIQCIFNLAANKIDKRNR
ncbi:methionine ABC transporter permease [Zongyangia hominis]|uniref:ABC transporter permease n=1 Tax=Zongyangia hominis TaxID=2763677 RepID=A0A926EDH6_9FIRM|nr:methionine ABC transporter permease [Zongyangia hominis]MBC8569757.1 ABC transporter permease [Zongyangia hominis]